MDGSNNNLSRLVRVQDEGDRARGVNPERLTNERRRWVTPSNDIAGPPTRLFEHVVVVGVRQEEVRRHIPHTLQKQARRPTNLKPEVLAAHPKDGHLKELKDPASFCLPFGANITEGPHSLKNGGSTSFNGDDSAFALLLKREEGTLYGVVLLKEEPIDSPLAICCPDDSEQLGDSGSEATQNRSNEHLGHKDGSSNQPTQERGPSVSNVYSMRAYCILSRLPVYQSHLSVLRSAVNAGHAVTTTLTPPPTIAQNQEEDQRRGDAPDTEQAENEEQANKDTAKDMEAVRVNTHNDNGAMRMLKRYGATPPPEMGASTVAGGTHVSRPTADEPAEGLEWAIASMCTHLSLKTLVNYIKDILLERSVAVVGSSLGSVSSVVLAFQPLISPLEWQSVLLPVLPDEQRDFLDAPVPLVVGVQRRPSSSNISRLSLSSGTLRSANWRTRMPKRNSLLSRLRPHHNRLIELCDVGEAMGFGKGEAALEARALADAAREWVQEELLGDVRAHSIADASKPDDRVAVLLDESFVGSFAEEDRTFAKCFVDTQMFKSYCDSVLAD